jgi:CNT family concentrative nucleoside transporter
MLVFWAPPSRRVFAWLNDAVVTLLDASQAGQRFLFGPLGDPSKTGGFVLALQALPTIIFFTALMGLLYYWRIMPRVVSAFAWLFTRLMRVSGAESLCTATNIFVGIESAATVRPYLAGMTRSEFCTILTAGMATVASSTMAVYVGFLHDVFPGIAGHLISASILSAPAAIVMSKILCPEDGEPVTRGRSVAPYVQRESSATEAVVSGAMAGVQLVLGICALLVAFLGMIALVDLALGWIGMRTGMDAYLAAGGKVHEPLSLKMLLAWVFKPVSFIMGVPWQDSQVAGELLGERLVATEVPAYYHLAEAIRAGTFVHPRSQVLIAYALCGFSHVASLAIFVGGITALVPERRKDLAGVGPRALLAATLACLQTGAVAGTFFLAR